MNVFTICVDIGGMRRHVSEAEQARVIGLFHGGLSRREVGKQLQLQVYNEIRNVGRKRQSSRSRSTAARQNRQIVLSAKRIAYARLFL